METITKFTDVFKNTFIEGYQHEITLEMMIFVLLFTLLLSFFVYWIYRVTIKDVPFSKGYAVSMSIISIITAAITIAIQTSIVISLGMVGALSIVRFRTAIKNPMDMLFMFWSISLGIITGAGLYGLAILLCVVVALGIMLYQIIPLKKAPHLLIAKMVGEAPEEEMINILQTKVKHYHVKSRVLRGDTLEIVVEINNLKDTRDVTRSINHIAGMSDVTMLAHDGEAIVQ